MDITGHDTETPMKIAIVGPGRSGKSTAARWLAANTELRYWGSTSKVILPFAAQWLGVSEDEAWETRHEHRDLWRWIGDDLRREDPAWLARKTLEHGDICEGVRAKVEIEAVRDEDLTGLIVWVERPGIDADETLGFGSEVADVVIENNGYRATFERRLKRLAGFAGL